MEIVIEYSGNALKFAPTDRQRYFMHMLRLDAYHYMFRRGDHEGDEDFYLGIESGEAAAENATNEYQIKEAYVKLASLCGEYFIDFERAKYYRSKLIELGCSNDAMEIENWWESGLGRQLNWGY